VINRIFKWIIIWITSRKILSKMQPSTLVWSKRNILMIIFSSSRTLWLWKQFWTKNILGIIRREMSLINSLGSRTSNGSALLEVTEIVSFAASSLSIFWSRWLSLLILPISLKKYNCFWEPSLKYQFISQQEQTSFLEIKLT